jgi:2,3-bisphosphoglycerate-dependent phosphoglycerate mutase
MELLLVRHALPVRQVNTDGPADPELSEIGHEQAKHLAAYLRTEAIHALYASPMRRARETATPLAQVTGLPMTIVDKVAEFDRHHGEYIPAEEMKATNHPRWQAMMRGEALETDIPPEEFHRDVVTAVDGLIDAHPGEKIAVVCHGGVINAYLSHVLGLSPSSGFFYPNYTSIHRVAASRNGHRSIVTVNETAHLRGTGLPMGMLG